ncbi:hypothetical protein EYR15_03450 [Hansschlegelia quercus]|uniref:Uncharacterized protein n=2 Tax=Hansschlegelia quercus TaxID=2528245 RepID=A0A4Q9GRE2_9HYPH|nr:hypothetical protein EYR15_03450 [Hansschlegelia quercus]
MATETIHIFQAWSAGKGNRLRAEAPIRFKSAAEAKGRAERGAEKFAGVVAISQVVDVDTGEVDENATVLFRAGRTPAEFGE